MQQICKNEKWKDNDDQKRYDQPASRLMVTLGNRHIEEDFIDAVRNAPDCKGKDGILNTDRIACDGWPPPVIFQEPEFW